MRGNLAVGITLLVFSLVATSLADEGLNEVNDYYAAIGEVHAPAGDKLAMVQAPLDAAESHCGDFSCCFQACQFPCVYFQADALYWDRIGTGCGDVLVINADDGSSLLSTDDLDFNGAPGARFLIGWQPHSCCSRCCAWELSYWGLYNWNADATAEGAGNLSIPGDLGLASNNFFRADTIVVDYRSELHNVEFNCIKSCCLDCVKLDFIAGLRYLALNDNLTLTATDLQEGTSSYDIDVHNDLYGFQFGGRLTQSLCCRWGLELTGKAALFYNDVSTNQLVSDFPSAPTPFILRDTSASRDGVAMLGEIGIVLIRPLSESWNLRLGYMAMGLGGVALATDQVDFTDTLDSGTAVNNTGWIFAHGVLAGLERRW